MGARARARWSGRLLALTAAVAAVVVAVDQLTKTWAVNALDDHDIHVLWTLKLNLTYNSGGAFSIGSGSPWFFVAAAAIVIAVVVAAGGRLRTALMAVAIGLVVGGALGNVADRLFRDTGGAVVDFIDLQWWPVFNLADAAICTGGALLVLAGLRDDR